MGLYLDLAMLGKLCRFLLPLLKGLLQALTLGSGLDLVLAPAWELLAGFLGADGSPEVELPSGNAKPAMELDVDFILDTVILWSSAALASSMLWGIDPGLY
jgi:hypothetical protein